MTTFSKWPANPNNIYKQAAQQNQVDVAMGMVNTGHPGQNMGLSLEQVKQMIANCPKALGVSFVSAAGTVNPKIEFPSTAKYLVGLSFANIAAGNSADVFTMFINEEQAIKGGSAFAFSVRTGSPQPYFDFFRPIGGSTSLKIDYSSIGGGDNLVLTLFYV